MKNSVLPLIFGLICLTSDGWTMNAKSKRRPNIVVLITDDQDVMLNSMSVMKHTKNRIIDKGVEFKNAFTTTPMCCPSRSSILTGLYTHNHHVYTNNHNCSSILWQRTHETKSFATYLNNSGYNTAYFGKYLNEYNGTYTPPGWNYWMAIAKNSKYYNYTLLHNGQKEEHSDDYAKDYLTDLVTNRSIEFFRNSKQKNPDQPILSVVSFPAPHGPEDGAPQYQHLFKNITSHITPSFDHAPNPDKHWIVQQMNHQMDTTQLQFSQVLHQKRLQTLISVDDGVKKITDMLHAIGELENTYILYFSDHGYHIGQFGLPKGKSMPYDFDIRIPFMMRGPRVPRNLRMDKIALNIDVAPTILGIADVPIPPELDGRNLLELFDNTKLEQQPWRDSFLVERGKMPRDRAHLVKPKLQKEKKAERMKKVCLLPEYKNPCEVGQFWTCSAESNGKLRLQKCKKTKDVEFDTNPKHKRRNGRKKRKLCPCPEQPRQVQRFDVNAETNDVPLGCGSVSGNRNGQGRRRLAKRNSYQQEMQGMGRRFKGSYNKLRKYGPEGHSKKNFGRIRRSIPNTFDISNAQGNGSNVRRSKGSSMILTSWCRLYMPNFEIRCLEDLYHDPNAWVKHMGHLARSLKTLQIKMKYMKTLRSCLNDYDQTIKGNQKIALCECPTPSPKPPRPKPEPQANASHPLTNVKDMEDNMFTERLREYQEQKGQLQLIKEMRQAKLARIAKRKERGRVRWKKCGEDKKVICFKLTSDTWKTEPLWDGEERCYCTNSQNNTYWCLRIINETTNALYCEFITRFVEYYDMNNDPHQLYNNEASLSNETSNALHNEMAQLRSCRGLENCTIKRPEFQQHSFGAAGSSILAQNDPRDMDDISATRLDTANPGRNFPIDPVYDIPAQNVGKGGRKYRRKQWAVAERVRNRAFPKGKRQRSKKHKYNRDHRRKYSKVHRKHRGKYEGAGRGWAAHGITMGRKMQEQRRTEKIKRPFKRRYSNE